MVESKKQRQSFVNEADRLRAKEISQSLMQEIKNKSGFSADKLSLLLESTSCPLSTRMIEQYCAGTKAMSHERMFALSLVAFEKQWGGDLVALTLVCGNPDLDSAFQPLNVSESRKISVLRKVRPLVRQLSEVGFDARDLELIFANAIAEVEAGEPQIFPATED